MDSGQLTENWNRVCDIVCGYDEVDPSQFKAFFYRLQPQAMSEGFLMLTADTDFIKTWVERHYGDFIRRALGQIYQGTPFTVVIEVDPSQAAAPASPAPSPATPVAAEPVAAAQPIVPTAAPTPSPVTPAVTPLVAQPTPTAMPVPSEVGASHPASMTPSWGEQPPAADPFPADNTDVAPSSLLTFENFVIGDSNRMAYSMALSVAEQPGDAPLNPLFIYGKSGLGKTHLMRAIQNYIRETQPHLRTVYVDSSDLLSAYMDASAAYDKEKSSYRNFKTKYEEADVLLIDDIQSLQGKKQTLDIVFQIFNNLVSRGKQIVLSADRSPKNIDIDERYYSRFSQGGVVDIQPPEVETKLGIIRSYIAEYRKNDGSDCFDIPEDIQLYIANNSSSNIRELKSAVTKVIFQMTFYKQTDLTMDEVRVLLEDHFSGGASSRLSIRDIQGVVEKFYRVDHGQMVGKSRTRSITHPRHVAIYLCRTILDLPFQEVAKQFNRDHSTVMHSVRYVEEKLGTSREVQEEIEILRKTIREL
ncbi:MAG: chromosomal replication initiator protein DnaA [Eggerthellaceae bacterium]|nr:chromosomal replication initiator protein DnaA [Eggerthellaceae bacterium]